MRTLDEIRNQLDQATERRSELWHLLSDGHDPILSDELHELEDRIATLEAEQKVRSTELADPSVYDEASRRNRLLSEYQAASDKLEELTARWEAAMAALEAAKAELGETP